MAFLDDDFQGYSVGSVVPFGSWVLDPGAFQAQIVSDGSGIPGTDRHLAVALGQVAFINLAYLSSFTEFCALRRLSGGGAFIFSNGPNGSNVTFSLLEIRIETDSTISAYCPATSEILANSGEALMMFRAWNFFQINVTFSDVTIAGVPRVHIECEVALNGLSIFSFATTTLLPIAQLANVTSEVNKFQLFNGDFAAYTLDTLQAIVTYPHAGTPKAIVYQGGAELANLPDSAKVAVSQGAIELATLPDSAKINIPQGVIELILSRRNLWYISES